MLSWIHSGGAIMWLILTGGFIALIIFLERLWLLFGGRNSDR